MAAAHVRPGRVTAPPGRPVRTPSRLARTRMRSLAGSAPRSLPLTPTTVATLCAVATAVFALRLQMRACLP